MTDPVLCSDAQTYERATIERWFEAHDTSPLTGAAIADRRLRIPNNALRLVIGLFQRYRRSL